MKINDIVISKKQRNGGIIIPYIIKEFKGAEDMADIVCTPKEFYNMFKNEKLK